MIRRLRATAAEDGLDEERLALGEATRYPKPPWRSWPSRRAAGAGRPRPVLLRRDGTHSAPRSRGRSRDRAAHRGGDPPGSERSLRVAAGARLRARSGDAAGSRGDRARNDRGRRRRGDRERGRRPGAGRPFRQGGGAHPAARDRSSACPEPGRRRGAGRGHDRARARPAAFRCHRRLDSLGGRRGDALSGGDPTLGRALRGDGARARASRGSLRPRQRRAQTSRRPPAMASASSPAIASPSPRRWRSARRCGRRCTSFGRSSAVPRSTPPT